MIIWIFFVFIMHSGREDCVLGASGELTETISSRFFATLSPQTTSFHFWRTLLISVRLTLVLSLRRSDDTHVYRIVICFTHTPPLTLDCVSARRYELPATVTEALGWLRISSGQFLLWCNMSNEGSNPHKSSLIQARIHRLDLWDKLRF